MTSTVVSSTIHVHISLRTSDLPRSIAFYRVLFAVEPAKHHADYAKFEIAQPPLVLSLEPGAPAGEGPLSHLGFRLPGSEDLVAIQHRLEEAGYPTIREDGVECCYAKQTKFWVRDPDGVMWEMYVLSEDLDHRGEGSVPAHGLDECHACP